MSKIKDLTGLKFGRLTVISKSDERGNKGQIKWDCVCECGNYHTVTGESLRSGKSKSCGCLKKEFIEKNKFKKEEDRTIAMLKIQYSHLKRRHYKKFSEEVIDFNTFCNLSKSKCYYCGLEYSKIIEDRNCESNKKSKISDTVLKINGIDRVDSGKGYIINNVVPCCKYCNMAKGEMSREDFLKWVKKVYEFNIIEINKNY